jgi:hypothetical protein
LFFLVQKKSWINQPLFLLLEYLVYSNCISTLDSSSLWRELESTKVICSMLIFFLNFYSSCLRNIEVWFFFSRIHKTTELHKCYEEVINRSFMVQVSPSQSLAFNFWLLHTNLHSKNSVYFLCYRYLRQILSEWNQHKFVCLYSILSSRVSKDKSHTGNCKLILFYLVILWSKMIWKQ